MSGSLQISYEDLIQLATFLVHGGAFLENSYEANLAEFFSEVWQLLVEISTDSDVSSLILLYEILYYLQDP